MVRQLYVLTLASTLLCTQALGARGGTTIEIGGGAAAPHCLLSSGSIDNVCVPELYPRGSGGVSWNFASRRRSTASIGLEFRKTAGQFSDAQRPMGSSELLLGVRGTTLSPTKSGFYASAGGTLDLIRFGKTTWDAASVLTCDGPCDELEGVGMVLIPLTPIVGAVAGIGVEAGVGVRSHGVSAGLHVMGDLFFASAELRVSYTIRS